MASLGSRWRTPLVLVMAGRRSPSVLLSLRVCIYTYMYTYTSRQAVVPCFLSLSVSPSSFLPFFLLHRGSHRRSPKGSTRRSADGLPNEHPTDHQTEIDRSRRRQPNRSPNSANRSPKRSPAGHPNRGKKERRGHRRIEQNRDQSPPTGEARMKNRVGSAPQLRSKTGSHVDQNSDTDLDPSDLKFNQKRDLVLIRSLTPTMIQNGIQV